ncbi:MAG: 2-C-methyl-D-erythritol 4-phosphate cytidylyltransferase [Planctomycetes bacterium]|nr:2-C-methyl-D-erythritol 4-phosphate cytidylyltransferase [Planctomycetota bacterium]
MPKKIAAIICAAGAGSRFGGKQKKQFAEVAGRAAFLRSIEFFDSNDDVKQIILCINPDDSEMFEVRYAAKLSFFGIKVCSGGPERFETVAGALKLVKDNIDLIAVHDAVRCCLKKEWIEQVFDRAAATGAAMLASPVVATLKRVENGEIIETVDRSGLYEAQTPQVFEAAILKKAYANLPNINSSVISDDSQLVEALGYKVAVVETDASNIKITTTADLAIAEAIIKSRPKPTPEGPVGPYNEAQW